MNNKISIGIFHRINWQVDSAGDRGRMFLDFFVEPLFFSNYFISTCVVLKGQKMHEDRVNRRTSLVEK